MSSAQIEQKSYEMPPARGDQHRAFSYRRRRRAIGSLLRKGLRRSHSASVVGGEGNFPQTPPAPVIREVSLILDGTLYTAVYDPPLKRDEKFSGLRRHVGIPARVDGDALFVKWPDGKEAKAKIIRREKINPNQPQPA